MSETFTDAHQLGSRHGGASTLAQPQPQLFLNEVSLHSFLVRCSDVHHVASFPQAVGAATAAGLEGDDVGIIVGIRLGATLGLELGAHDGCKEEGCDVGAAAGGEVDAVSHDEPV